MRRTALQTPYKLPAYYSSQKKKQREKKWKGQGIFTLHFILFAFIAFVDTKQKEYLSPIQNQKARKRNKILSKTCLTSDGLSNKIYIIDVCVIVLIIQKLIFTCFVLYLSYLFHQFFINIYFDSWCSWCYC